MLSKHSTELVQSQSQKYIFLHFVSMQTVYYPRYTFLVMVPLIIIPVNTKRWHKRWLS